MIEQSQHFSSLEVEFFKDKIWAAVAKCDSNKALGLNGLNMTCYQKGWKFVKGDILTFLQEFYINNSLVGGLNSSFITMVPEKDNPSGIQDYKL